MHSRKIDKTKKIIYNCGIWYSIFISYISIMWEEQLAETIKQQHEEILVLTQKIQKLQSWLIEADEILSDDNWKHKSHE